MSTKKLLCILASVVLAVTLLTFGAVAEDTAVAKIGDTTYATVEAAFSEASSGDTITLLSNATISTRITVSTTVTLDLNGYTLSGSGFTVNGGNLTVTGGRISGTQPFNVYGGSADQANYSVLTIESNVTISEATWGICLFPQSNSEKLGYGATINMYGIIASTTSDSNGIFVSGNLGNSTETSDAMAKSDNVSVVNIYGTIDTVSQAVAMNGYAVVNVYSGATISGSEAIGVKRGVLNVYGGTLYATGSYIDPATANYNGTEDTGAAISVTSTYNYAGEIVVNVYGGTITSYYGNAVYVGHSSSNSSSTTYTEGVTLVLYGGTYTGSSSAGAVYVAEAISGDASTYTQYVVCGGTYSSDVTSYISEETGLIQDSTGAVVTAPSVASVNGTQYTSLEAALAAATSGSTVTLLADVEYDSNITVASGSSLTLDVGTYTLDLGSSQIGVSGTLTIEGTTGTITSTTSKGAALIQVDGSSASVTLNGGNLVNEATNGYGIYCLDGGTAIVNDGSITSQSAALAGNNTTGDMNFEVNGGTLTAGDGAAIYMPGQVNLVITGGTLNGGISLRMGQVTITGGTIIAITDNIDDIASYYSYSGNVWLGDALYVMGGTYTSESSYGNSLVINISGGEFICNNDSGNAIAIYNLDKVAQTATVNITGGTFTSAGGAAYAVIDFSDLGVTNSSYGVSENVVTTKISGGTFTGSSVAVSISDSSVATTSISAGTFSHDVDDSYIVTGLDAIKLGGVWIIGTRSDISFSSTETNGTASIVDSLTSAISGQTVTITATPESGYYKAKVIVTDANGKSVDVTDNLDGTYSFTMPNSAVTVSVSFVRVKDEISGIFYVNESYHGIMVNGHLLSIPHTVNEAGYCTTCGAYIGVEEEEVELEEGVTEEIVEITDPVESGETDSEDDGEEAPAETPAEEETNPTTGVALGLIPMAIAAVAVAVSKKH